MTDRDNANEASRIWRLRNREKHLAACRRWRQEHPDQTRASRLAWTEKNLEHRKAYEKEYKRTHKESATIAYVSRRYGVTREAASVILEITTCGLCGAVATDIDHDHKTGTIRGRLCRPCNIAIHDKHDAEWHMRVAEYLTTHVGTRDNPD